jgi:uncharacterized Zn finger protein (UPF0148 family)
MATVEVQCSQCGSGEYQLLDAKTGEVICRYCRNKWVVPELVVKSETEKFLEQQAKQPRVIQDNSTETDRQLMEMVSGLARSSGLNPLAAIGRFFRGIFSTIGRIVTTVLVVAGIILIAILVYAYVNGVNPLSYLT